jgi:transketolase
MSATRKRPLRGGPRIQAVAGQAEGGQPPEQPTKRLTTSAMIASLAGPEQRTRPAPFGHALVGIAKDRPEIVGMTADLSKYTDLHIFAREFPDRFYQMGMAEQLLMLAAAGMAHEGFVPFVTTYAVFASRRTYDFVSQGIAEEGLNVKICCALPGLTTGYGPSHQATEDVAIFRGMPDLTIVYPCDALDTEQATRAIAAHDGPVYMRLLRGNVPLVLDEYDYTFELGKAKLVRDGGDALVVSSGIMTMRALETAKLLEQDRVSVAVLHVPTIKPLDEETILREAGRGGRLVVVAENHTIVGGLGEAVAAALLRSGVTPKFRQVALPDEFLDAGALPTLHDRYGISAEAMSGSIKGWL